MGNVKKWAIISVSVWYRYMHSQLWNSNFCKFKYLKSSRSANKETCKPLVVKSTHIMLKILLKSVKSKYHLYCPKYDKIWIHQLIFSQGLAEIEMNPLFSCFSNFTHVWKYMLEDCQNVWLRYSWVSECQWPKYLWVSGCLKLPSF